MYTLHVDYRESFFTGIEHEQGVFSTENLVIGDFLIKNESGDIVYIFERKTIADLNASIRDDRFREQKSRLEKSIDDSSKIVYIIEKGKKTDNKWSLPSSTINSAITNLVFLHNFKVIHTESSKDTILFIWDLFKKLNNDKQASTSSFKPVKKSSTSNENALACQLTTINGVSWEKALKIQSIYGTMEKMIDTVRETKIVESVGKSLSSKIYTALFIKVT